MLTLQRKKLRDREVQQIKSNIIQNLPVLNKREIRRHRMIYYEALFKELLEDEFEESAYFLRGLIDYQDNVYKLAGDEALAWNKPILKNDHRMLDILYEGLKVAEAGLKNDKKTEEVGKLLKLAIFFSNQIEAWWWIAEQLFMIAIIAVKDYVGDGNKMHAMARYAFGRFLLKQLEDVDRSKYNLRISRDLSVGENWETINVPNSNLFKECCTLLCDAFLITSTKTLKTDPALALKLANVAYKRARSGEYTAGEISSLYQKGLCEFALKRPDDAIQNFNKVLIGHYSNNNQTGICNTRIGLARAYNMLDKFTESKYHLHQLLHYTQKHDLKSFLAHCHLCLGKLHLLHNIGQEACTHFMTAFELYLELGDYDKSGIAKSLAAIATGIQLNQVLMKLINNCGKKESNTDYVLKLVHYKDNRTPFWTEDDMSNITYLKQLMKIYEESENDTEDCVSPKPSLNSNVPNLLKN